MLAVTLRGCRGEVSDTVRCQVRFLCSPLVLWPDTHRSAIRMMGRAFGWIGARACILPFAAMVGLTVGIAHAAPERTLGSLNDRALGVCVMVVYGSALLWCGTVRQT